MADLTMKREVAGRPGKTRRSLCPGRRGCNGQRNPDRWWLQDVGESPIPWHRLARGWNPVKPGTLVNTHVSRLLAELHRDSLYPMMGKDAWVAGADRREAPGPKPVRLGRRLRLRRQPPGSWQLWNGGVQRGVSNKFPGNRRKHRAETTDPSGKPRPNELFLAPLRA